MDRAELGSPLQSLSEPLDGLGQSSQEDKAHMVVDLGIVRLEVERDGMNPKPRRTPLSLKRVSQVVVSLGITGRGKKGRH
jgi:hypothetical protein